MTLILLIIILILGFIAYQLYHSNQIKNQHNLEEKIREQMPNLYKKSIHAGLKTDIESFMLEYPYMQHNFDVMKRTVRTNIENEMNTEQKKKMEFFDEKLSEMMGEARKYLANTIATDYEIQYLLFRFYEKAFNNFPETDIEFDAFIHFSGYKSLLPAKTLAQKN